MNNSFLTAAASYYGLSLDQVQQDSEIDTSTGEFVAVMRILMTPEDLIGVAQRMKVMREEEAQKQPEPESNQWSHKDVEQCRAEYDAMAPAQKSQFGSYARYQAYRMMGNEAPIMATAYAGIDRKVEHINAPEDSEPVSMDAVWLWEHQTTEVQRRFASDTRGEPGHERQYLIQSAMLTEEQKAQYQVEKPLSAIEAAVLGGKYKQGDPLPDDIARRIERAKAEQVEDRSGGLPG